LLAPVRTGLLWTIRNLSWWLVLLFGLYLASGMTIVQPDEVAVVYRFGNLRNAGTAQAVAQPGMLLALPKPFERVERIPVQKVFEQKVEGLHFRAVGQMTFLSSSTLDPEKVGYALTGDGNVVHVSFSVNYQIDDPVLYATQIDDVKPMLDNIVRSVALQEIARRSVDSILSDGREDMVQSISAGTGAEIARLRLGVRIVSLEMVDLVPPYQIKDEFSAVQTSSIEAQTAIQEAEEYRSAQLPKAQTTYNREVSKASSSATQIIATAKAEASVFEQLALEAKSHPEVVYRRLLQERLEVIGKSAGDIRFIPPPLGASYPEGYRILLEREQ
jgi:membrane protease subunit HflK